jgi:hypothetical protein
VSRITSLIPTRARALPQFDSSRSVLSGNFDLFCVLGASFEILTLISRFRFALCFTVARLRVQLRRSQHSNFVSYSARHRIDKFLSIKLNPADVATPQATASRSFTVYHQHASQSHHFAGPRIDLPWRSPKANSFLYRNLFRSH